MLSPETFFVPSTDGVEVAVHDYGGQGRLLMLNHATGFCGQVWQPMIELLRTGFHCVAMDFRAHGMTELPAGIELVWQGMARDFEAVVDHVSPGQPVWVAGHSMGGTAVILAETARPGLVERAWTYEPILLRNAPVLTGDEGPAIAQGARRRRAEFPSRDEARQRFAGRPPLSLLDPDVLHAYVEHGFADQVDGSIVLRCSPESEASIFEHHNCGSFEAAGQLSIPFAAGAGGEGEGPAAWVREAASVHGSLTLVEYPDLTHFGPLQDPRRLAVDIAGFFGG